MMQALSYAFAEARGSLWRGRRSGVLSTGTIALALFVLGGFLLATANLRRLGDEWSRAAELSIYMKDDASGADRAAIERLLAPGPVVASYEFVSKDQALERFTQTFADLATAVNTVDGNPLPASYEARLQTTADARQGVDALAETLRSTQGVVDVRYDRQWLDRLLSAVSVLRAIGLGLGLVLIGASALTVATVVRLSLYARRDEIEIMQLVGAPQAYVRGPFIMEGTLQGGLGAVAALVVLALGYAAIRGRYLVPLAQSLNLSSVRFLSPGLCLVLLGGGMLVGCLGGLVASRRT
jgi:cell division transport system permease protein